MMRVFTLLICILALGSCTRNYFDEFAKKDTKEALFFDAKLKLDESDFSTAIARFNSLSTNHPGYYADNSMASLHASAYAGRCGLDFISLLTNIQNAPPGALFSLLMSSFPGATTTSYTDCLDAENLLETIGDHTVRSGDENLLMAFLSLAKIGVILSSRADADDDQATDAGFDQCNTTHLPTIEAREIGSGLSHMILSLAAVGTSYIDVSEITTMCGLDPQLAAFCNTTDPTTFTDPQLSVLRVAVGASDTGINSCADNDFNNCLIANPPPGCGP